LATSGVLAVPPGRLSKDYETLPASSESMIHLAMIDLMLHRLKSG